MSVTLCCLYIQLKNGVWKEHFKIFTVKCSNNFDFPHIILLKASFMFVFGDTKEIHVNEKIKVNVCLYCFSFIYYIFIHLFRFNICSQIFTAIYHLWWLLLFLFFWTIQNVFMATLEKLFQQFTIIWATIVVFIFVVAFIVVCMYICQNTNTCTVKVAKVTTATIISWLSTPHVFGLKKKIINIFSWQFFFFFVKRFPIPALPLLLSTTTYTQHYMWLKVGH